MAIPFNPNLHSKKTLGDFRPREMAVLRDGAGRVVLRFKPEYVIAIKACRSFPDRCTLYLESHEIDLPLPASLVAEAVEEHYAPQKATESHGGER